MPPITLGTPNSDTAIVNTTIAAETRPYFAPGSVIVRNLRQCEAPIASAASYRRASDNDNEASRIITACGNAAKAIASTIPGNP